MTHSSEKALIDHLQPPKNLSAWFTLPVCLSVCGVVFCFTGNTLAASFLFTLSLLAIPLLLYLSAHQQDKAKAVVDHLRKTGTLENALKDFETARGILRVGRFGSRYFFAYGKPFIVSYQQIRIVKYDKLDSDGPETAIILLTKNGDRFPLLKILNNAGDCAGMIRQIKAQLQGKCPLDIPF